MILVDRKPFFEFLPMLPDIIGGWMEPKILRRDLSSLVKKERAEYVKSEIKSIDPGNKVIKTDGGDIIYEYAVLATGSKTDFYGNSFLQRSCLKLDNVDDAVSVRETILQKACAADEINILVAGGGYTGIEIATNINFALNKEGIKHKIFIVEKNKDILMMVPDWIRSEIKRELEKLGIKVRCGEALKEYDGEAATLESGRRITNALCIWAAGVKTSDFVKEMKVPTQRTRVVVDKELRPRSGIFSDIFVAGDNSFFEGGTAGKALRMAVMFSMGQGKTAADNIARSIIKKPLIQYSPVDLGYLVPVANGKAPGIIMGSRIHGLLGYLMHYFMCAFRSEWRNKAGVLKRLVLKNYGSKKGGAYGQK